MDLDTVYEYAQDSEDKFDNVEATRYKHRVEVEIPETNTTIILRPKPSEDIVAVDVEKNNHSADALLFDSEGVLEDFLLNEIQQYM